MKELEIYHIPREKMLLGPTAAIFNPKVRSLCKTPFFDHPGGCPNFGIRPSCPPNAPLFTERYDVSSPVYMAVIRFAFDQYLAMRKREHPDWSIRKLRNPRLYQGHLRSELRKFVSEIMPKMDQEYKPEYDGEAMGIDFASMFPAVGLTWVFPPQTYNYRVCLIAKRKQ